MQFMSLRNLIFIAEVSFTCSKHALTVYITILYIRLYCIYHSEQFNALVFKFDRAVMIL